MPFSPCTRCFCVFFLCYQVRVVVLTYIHARTIQQYVSTTPPAPQYTSMYLHTPPALQYSSTWYVSTYPPRPLYIPSLSLGLTDRLNERPHEQARARERTHDYVPTNAVTSLPHAPLSIPPIMPLSSPRPLHSPIHPVPCCCFDQAHLKRQRDFLYGENEIPPEGVKTETHGVVLWSTLPEPARCAGRVGERLLSIRRYAVLFSFFSTYLLCYLTPSPYSAYRQPFETANRTRLEPDCTTLRELDVNHITIIGTVLGQVRFSMF